MKESKASDLFQDFVCIHHRRFASDLCISQIKASTSPPRAYPGYLTSFPTREGGNLINLGRVLLGSVRNKNNWNNASKRLFGSYSHSEIPGFPFRLFCSQEHNIFRNIFLFRNISNERALSLPGGGHLITTHWGLGI